MKNILLASLLAFFAFVFTGCFSFTEEIIQEPDNTYTLSRTVSLGTSIIDMIGEFKKLGDTTGIDSVTFRQQLLDSLRGEWGGEIDTLKSFPGYITSSVRDTLIDTMFHIITSVRVSDPKFLPLYHKSIWKEANKNNPNEKEQMNLVVEKKNDRTIFRYEFPKVSKEEMKQSKEEKDQAKQFLKDVHIYFRFKSPNLLPPKPKSGMKLITGGQEYELPLLKMLDGKLPPRSIEFVVK